jgi:hypothetical protein
LNIRRRNDTNIKSKTKDIMGYKRKIGKEMYAKIREFKEE